MKEQEETECKEAEQIEVVEKSKKKNKKEKRKVEGDDERDSYTQDKDEQRGDKSEKTFSLKQSTDSKNSEPSHGGTCTNNGSLANKEETECKDAAQIQVAKKSKKKKKNKKGRCEDGDNKRDSYTQHKGELLGDELAKNVCLKQSSVSETNESDNRVTNGASCATKDKEETKCKDDEPTEEEEEERSKTKKKVEDDKDEKDSYTRDGGDELSNKQGKSLSSKQTEIDKNSVSTNSSALKDKEETECKDAGQIEVAEKNKKKKKRKRKRKSQVHEDGEKDSSFSRTTDKELGDEQTEGVSLNQAVGENSEADERVGNSGTMKDKEETECKDAGQIEVADKTKKKKKRKRKRKSKVEENDGEKDSCTRTEVGKNSESDNRATNSVAMKKKEETECKDAEQTEVANKKMRKSQVQEDDDKNSCVRTEDGVNSESNHRATNSGAMKKKEETECKDDVPTEAAEKSRKKKKKRKRKSQVQEDGNDDKKNSWAQSGDEGLGNEQTEGVSLKRVEFRKDIESSDIVNSDDSPKDNEGTECENDAKKKKKTKRKREECLIEAEGVMNDAGDHCAERQEGQAKKTKESKDEGRTENKLMEKKLKSKEKSDLPEEKDEAVDSQWQSAEFGDTAQKEKFLRLMGAYKPCNKERSASSYSVMAMNKQEEKAFSSSLEKQFLQAMQTRKERGTGLGYQ